MILLGRCTHMTFGVLWQYLIYGLGGLARLFAWRAKLKPELRLIPTEGLAGFCGVIETEVMERSLVKKLKTHRKILRQNKTARVFRTRAVLN